MLFPQYVDEKEFNLSFINYNDIWRWKSPSEITWKSLILLIVALLAITANLVMILLVIKNKTLHKSNYILLANLSVASVLLNLFSPFAFLLNNVGQFFILGELGCHLSSSYLILYILVSGFSYAVISCDSLLFFFFFHLYGYKLKIKLSLLVVAFIWIVAIIFSAPVFLWKTYRMYNYTDILSRSCRNSPEVKENNYYVLLIIISTLIPVVITSITYILIICKIQKYKRNQSVLSSSMRHRNKVLKAFFMIMAIYFWCGLPFTTLLLFQMRIIITSGELPKYVKTYIEYVAHLLMYGQCALSPFIFGWKNEEVRKAFWRMFKCCRRNQVYPSFVTHKNLRKTVRSRMSAPPIIEDIGKKNRRVTINVPENPKSG